MAACALAAAVRAPLGGFPLLLVLHPAVLEPDFHLLLRQVQVRGDFDSSESRQVHVRGELPFEFQELRARERRAHPLAILYVAVLRGACWRGGEEEKQLCVRHWISYHHCELQTHKQKTQSIARKSACVKAE